jgi:ATP-dependent Clp protease ATP-binding subunit ClpA
MSSLPWGILTDYLSSESQAVGNKHWLVPRRVNKLFTGRSEIIDRIKGAIQDDSVQHAEKQKVFVITGLGGMGKTEICLQVANTLREE